MPIAAKIRGLLVFALAVLTTLPAARAAVTIAVETPMAPPNWALLQRELLEANAAACREFFDRYFDHRGYLECVERWGGDDGPDDAIENLNDWPILYALGGDDDILRLIHKGWEGHLRQYTEAKTVEVPFARDGMYYKEFPVTFDWLHHGEGLTVFNLMGLCDPNHRLLRQRVRRYAGFYMNEDPQALNYDPKHKIIRSMFNGSRGPLLRKATALDWAGDPIEVAGRFKPLHGEKNYPQMLAHFKDYNDIIGDHPQNLGATSLALNAYMLTGQRKYQEWLLEYVDAWAKRTEENGGIIPTNIGLDGTIGGATDGKWYGGVYGWGFTVIVPQTGEKAHRNTHQLGVTGFLNAYMLTADDRYLDVWRTMIDKINANGKTIDGKEMTPTMFGDDGWYAYRPGKYRSGALEIYFMSQRPDDRRRVGANGWLDYLEGKNPGYPEEALRAGFATIREKIQAMRADQTTPDTRLADDPMRYNPATVRAMIELALGGIHPGHKGALLHCRLRYFDPIHRRPGLPPDVAALVETMSAEEITVTLVNVHQTEKRTLLVQTGAYAEHQCQSVHHDEPEVPVDRSWFRVKLGPGSGTRMRIQTRRYANQPTLLLPWDRTPPGGT